MGLTIFVEPLCYPRLTTTKTAPDNPPDNPPQRRQQIKVTGYRLLVTTAIIGFGTWKAVASWKQQYATSNMLDWVIGAPLALM